jgi:Zn-dependent peptidase ImmA (M78 family)
MHPEREAEQIRRSAWGSGFPVDPVQIARSLGIDVKQAYLSESVSGALVKQIGQDPTILLNGNDHPNRQRFTCAHELGHYVSRANDPDAYEYVDRRDTIWSAAGVDQNEIFANQFAAALLMPAEAVKDLVKRGYTPVQMALFFDVSQDSMSFRLKNLKLAA